MVFKWFPAHLEETKSAPWPACLPHPPLLPVRLAPGAGLLAVPAGQPVLTSSTPSHWLCLCLKALPSCRSPLFRSTGKWTERCGWENKASPRVLVQSVPTPRPFSYAVWPAHAVEGAVCPRKHEETKAQGGDLISLVSPMGLCPQESGLLPPQADSGSSPQARLPTMSTPEPSGGTDTRLPLLAPGLPVSGHRWDSLWGQGEGLSDVPYRL